MSAKMIKKDPYSQRLIRGVTAHKVEYLINAKSYIRATSFDEVAVVLFVAAQSYVDRGVTEKQISDKLGVPRSSVNRLVKILLDGKKIIALDNTRPRQYTYNFEFAKDVYGKNSEEIRDDFYNSVLSGYADAVGIIIEELANSQYGKRAK